MDDSKKFSAILEYLYGDGYVTHTRLPCPSQPEIAEKNIAFDFSNPVPNDWRKWVETKNMLGERTMKDPYKPSGCCFYNENYEGGSSSTNNDVTNTSNLVNYLVLVSCKICMNYMMVMRKTRACPKCSGGLVKFEHERCF